MGEMKCQRNPLPPPRSLTCGVSDLWGVALVGCRTCAVSDLWAVGLVGCRTCETTPFVWQKKRREKKSRCINSNLKAYNVINLFNLLKKLMN